MRISVGKAQKGNIIPMVNIESMASFLLIDSLKKHI